MDHAYDHPAFGMQMTGGSMSVLSSWDQMRKAGATGRALLVAAAARDLERRPVHVPGGERRRRPRSERAAPELRGPRREGRLDAGAQGRSPQGPEGLQAGRQGHAPPRHAGEAGWPRSIRPRRDATGHADGAGGPAPRLRREGRLRERREGSGGPGGEGGRHDPERGGGRSDRVLGRQAGAGRSRGGLGSRRERDPVHGCAPGAVQGAREDAGDVGPQDRRTPPGRSPRRRADWTRNTRCRIWPTP